MSAPDVNFAVGAQCHAGKAGGNEYIDYFRNTCHRSESRERFASNIPRALSIVVTARAV
jgi:hypothetical protein